MRRARHGRGSFRMLALLIASTLAVGVSTATVAPEAVAETSGPPSLTQRNDSVVTADPLPTVQIEKGYIWAQATSGSTVFAGGDFDNARFPEKKPGSYRTPRQNLLAFNITTGELLPWAPKINGSVRAIAVSPDGKRVYVGGSFNTVNGEQRWNFATLDAKTGALIDSVRPAIGGSGVFGIAATSSSVYLTGLFTQANGVARSNNAAISASNGALLSWAPKTNMQGDAIAIEPGTGQIVLAGRFTTVNGAEQRGLANVHPGTGALNDKWQAPDTIKNGRADGKGAGKAGIFALATDKSGVYGTGWRMVDSTVGNLEGTFAAEAGSGKIRWVADCLGDSYGVYSTGKTVYSTSHTHTCDSMNFGGGSDTKQYRFASAFTATAEGTLRRNSYRHDLYQNFTGTPAPAPYAWQPGFTTGDQSGLNQAGLSITGAGNIISIAGEFPSVNGQQFEGIVRFSTNPPKKAEGPILSGDRWKPPTASSVRGGSVLIAVPGNWSRDDVGLTYELRRSDLSGVLQAKKSAAGWSWEQPYVRFTDKTAKPGTKYTYTVRAVDADGNAVTSKPVTVTAATSGPSAYADKVLRDGAELYYPLGDDYTDPAGGDRPSLGRDAAKVTPGAVLGSTGAGAAALNGSQLSVIASSARLTKSKTLSMELWFNTKSTKGGTLAGLGSTKTVPDPSDDRQIAMGSDGRLNFSVKTLKYGLGPDDISSIRSAGAYNDGKWHHAVATIGSDGIALFVDGKEVARDTSTTSGADRRGFWRLGGQHTKLLADASTAEMYQGSIDEFAVYNKVLTPDQIKSHYSTGKR